MSYTYKLTDKGKEEVSHFLRECEAFRKEILDAGKDTADDTYLPDEESIVSDIEEWIDEDGYYINGWGVTDNYSLPISLIEGEDFEAV